MLPSRDPKRIPWQRYWVKHDGEYLPSHLGYLLRPTPEKRFNLQRDVVTYDQVAARPFIALMGETGSGKTDAIAEIGHSLEDAGQNVQYIDLGIVDTSDALRRELDTSKGLVEDGKEVTLLFDQYEVSGLGENTDQYIEHALSLFPLGRTKVRLGCRSGSWTAETERQFLKLWPDLLALEICPLTRDDVTLALSSLDGNAPDLLDRLEDRELAPLLLRPVTLRLIISMLERGDDVSSLTITEVYQRGLAKLVRPSPGRQHTLEDVERLAVARRIAAASIFCRRPIISDSPDDGRPLAGTMHIADLARGKEPTNDGEDSVCVSQVAVAEVLRHSGLLNSRGTGRHGWAHASYAEYLAAEYVRSSRMPPEQIHGLLRLRDDGSPLIPELQGVVSWLLTNESLPFGDEFISKWPTAVLRSDVQSLTVKQRDRLVGALLDDAERGVLDTRSAVIRLRLGKLAHPGLAPQLERYIANKDKSVRTRGLAMQIAASCRLDDLANLIAAIALDKSEARDVREKAAHTVTMMSDEGARKALFPLVDPGDDADADDQLRGAAFEALWPKHMTSEQLFRLLSDPRRDHFVGSYAVFLSELSEHLGPTDLEPALTWASGNRSTDDFGQVRRVVDKILFRAFANLDRPRVLERVASIFISRASAHLHLFEEDEDDSAPLGVASRRLLVAHIATRLSAEELSKVVIWARPSLLDSTDVDWLISKLDADASGPWPHLLSNLVLIHREKMLGEHLGTLSDSADKYPPVREALRWVIGPIVIDSPQAEQARRNYNFQQQWAVRDAAADSQEAQRRAILEAVLAGDVGQFIDLPYALADKHDDLGLDLIALPGWSRLLPEQQEQIHAVARDYLVTGDEHRAEWLGRNRYPYIALAGYRALRLLRHRAGGLENLPVDVWAKWVGIVIAMPFEHDKERDAQRDFVRHVSGVARDALDDALRTFVASDEMSGHHHLLSLFPAPWDNEFVGLIEEAVRDGSEKGRMSLIEDVLVGSPERGEALAWDLVGRESTANETKQRIYALLTRLGGTATRARVRRDIFSSSNEMGREVIQLLASALESKSRDMNQRMSDGELADLYTWVERNCPARDGDDGFRGVGRLRNDLLTSLGQRSTSDTVSALQSLVNAFPQHAYLRQMHHDAEERVATETWNPPTVSELIALAKDPLKRFIESGDDLQTAIVESLTRLGAELTRTETPMAEFLWNDCPACEPRFVSKDESALSNLVKRHLEMDLAGRGIVVNREVEVRRSGSGMGQRTDIHVRAARLGTPVEEARSLTVIVETKKCSNASLMTALKSQLVDDYLKPHSYRNGIYLVGRFDNPAHRCCSTKRTLSALRATLEKQAKLVAPDYRVTAVVLDTALPTSMIRKKRPGPRRGQRKHTTPPPSPRKPGRSR